MFRSLAESKGKFFFEYEYQVKLQKKQWRDDLKRLKEIKKRGKDSINDCHDTRDDEVPTPVLIPLPDFVLRVEGCANSTCMYDRICKARLTGLCFLFVEGYAYETRAFILHKIHRRWQKMIR